VTFRGPDNARSPPRSRRAYPDKGRGPAWSARGLLAVILAIVAVALAQLEFSNPRLRSG
jgi:hypothetical protein